LLPSPGRELQRQLELRQLGRNEPARLLDEPSEFGRRDFGLEPEEGLEPIGGERTGDRQTPLLAPG
jgi:hypothetical protein